MITVKVIADGVIAKFKKFSASIPQAISAAVTKLTAKLFGAILQGEAGATGALADATSQSVTTSAFGAVGAVTVAPGKPYAAIQEFGGTIPPHDIYPVAGQALKFMIGAETVFAKVVHHPGAIIKPKNYAHGPLEAMEPEIVADIEGAVRDATQ